MAERRTPTDPKALREEAGSLTKKDPRRESTGPSLFIGLLQEVQRDLVAIRTRLTDLEVLVAEERQARLLAEVGPTSRADGKRPRTASARPPAAAVDGPMQTKPTINLRAASTRPPPRGDGSERSERSERKK